MTAFKLLRSPIRFAAVSAVACGTLFLPVASLLQGRGQFVWDWEVAAMGGFAALVGAVRGWKEAGELRDAGECGSESLDGDAPAEGDAPSDVISRNELYWKLTKAAHVRAVLTMLSLVPALPVAAGCDFVLARAGVPRIVSDSICLVLLFGIPTIVAAILTEHYCKRGVLCPHCGHSLWECGSGNFKPGRIRVRPCARDCPGCSAPIV